MVTKPKFEAIGDILSPGVAFVQAAQALDVVGYIAQKQEDTETLLKVAGLYMELSERMMVTIEETEEVDEEALAKKTPLGFSPQVQLEIVPEIAEEELVDE